MKLPTFWSRATAEQSDNRGGRIHFSCWRWSDISAEDARRNALEAAERVIAAILAGKEPQRYSYGPGAIREDVKQRFYDEQGHLTAAITQNAYGSLVLNALHAMFVDIDLTKPSAAAILGHQARKLFHRAQRSPAELIESHAIQRVAAFFRTERDWSARLYRTHSGLRLFVTHTRFSPAGEDAQRTFAALNADPLYIRLCRNQQCFRARLTPKPWRCGHSANRISWPHDSEEQQRKFDAWHEVYLEKQAYYSTCRLLETFGPGEVAPAVAPLIELHDQLARCDEALPLA